MAEFSLSKFEFNYYGNWKKGRVYKASQRQNWQYNYLIERYLRVLEHQNQERQQISFIGHPMVIRDGVQKAETRQYFPLFVFDNLQIIFPVHALDPPQFPYPVISLEKSWEYIFRFESLIGSILEKLQEVKKLQVEDYYFSLLLVNQVETLNFKGFKFDAGTFEYLLWPFFIVSNKQAKILDLYSQISRLAICLSQLDVKLYEKLTSGVLPLIFDQVNRIAGEPIDEELTNLRDKLSRMLFSLLTDYDKSFSTQNRLRMTGILFEVVSERKQSRKLDTRENSEVRSRKDREVLVSLLTRLSEHQAEGLYVEIKCDGDVGKMFIDYRKGFGKLVKPAVKADASAFEIEKFLNESNKVQNPILEVFETPKQLYIQFALEKIDLLDLPGAVFKQSKIMRFWRASDTKPYYIPFTQQRMTDFLDYPLYLKSQLRENLIINPVHSKFYPSLSFYLPGENHLWMKIRSIFAKLHLAALPRTDTMLLYLFIKDNCINGYTSLCESMLSYSCKSEVVAILKEFERELMKQFPAIRTKFILHDND